MKMRNNLKFGVLLIAASALITQCKKDNMDEMVTPTPAAVAISHDPYTTAQVSVDRFSSTFGHLMVRNSSNGLPAANAPINFDQAPFITKGFGPLGNVVEYYNFDVQSAATIPIYVFFQNGNPVSGQLNIIDKIPGDTAYTDFWLVNKVDVPSDYVVNSVTSLLEIQQKGYAITATTMIVNCPVVPSGSIATRRIGNGNGSTSMGWYKNKVVFYFDFSEAPLTAVGGMVPTSPIYVTFNINPTLPGGGPPSGFVTEPSSTQTHNIIGTVPGNTSYSPLWSVNMYDNTNFNGVNNLSSALSSSILVSNAALVNCPVVIVQ